MRHLSNLGLTLLILAMLAGCGQKGPLYLPGDKEAAATYDPGNEYDDEDAGENAAEGEGTRNGNNDDDAEATPTTSGGEG